MSGISNRLKLLEKLLADLESDEAMPPRGMAANYMGRLR